MSKDIMLNELRSLGFCLKSKSQLHTSLIQYCNQSIKKIYSEELLEKANSQSLKRSGSNVGGMNMNSAGLMQDDKNTLWSFMLK